MRSLTLTFAAFLLGLAAFLPASVARAGTFDVSPVRIELSPTIRTAVFTVRNNGDAESHLQVSAFAWAQSPGGEMLLSPTQDVVFFPSMLSIPPGASRKIRVGTSAAFAAVEKSYRVFVEELPPSGGASSAVRVLTRMGLPVFFAALAPRPEPVVRGLALRGARLSFALDDRGTSHFMTRGVRVLGKDSSGRVVFEKRLSGWYVLAGGTRDYALELPASACASVVSIEVSVDTDTATVSAVLARQPGACS